jgi:predicted enzyme related to lactoylglutathione lyase
MQTNNVVGWFELYVDDMDRARAFYGQVFQRELVALQSVNPDYQMYAFPWTEGAQGAAGALVKTSMMQAGKGGTLVYFSCSDVAEESARAAQAGGKIVLPRMAIGEYGFIAMIEDTEGNMIGLHSMR